jgi:hypothetical protein
VTYSLKVDWSGYRAQAVIDAVEAGRTLDLASAVGTLRLYVDPERMGEYSTIKLDWPEDTLNRVEAALDAWLTGGPADRAALTARDSTGPRTYMEVVYWQTQVHAALRDIREYRAGVATGIALSLPVSEFLKESGAS